MCQQILKELLQIYANRRLLVSTGAMTLVQALAQLAALPEMLMVI